MDAIGAQELLFPALLPREPYEATGRWTEYGDSIFRLKDRKGGDYLLGPTHEEMFTLVVKDLYSSYKDLPLSIYQIQTKYRDEARPRAGLLRGREFAMKDSYSFDIDDAGLDASYQRHRDAYIRIFDRLGFEYVIVKATSGAMGGSKSEEFLAKAAVGEDTYVRCTQLRLRRQRRGGPGASARARRRTTTRPPRTPSRRRTRPTIETLVDHLNEKFPRDDRPWTAGDTLKNVLVVLKHPDGTREPIAIGLPGDREVDQKRLEGQLEPDRGRAVRTRPTSRSTPRWSRATSAPACWGRRTPPAIRYLVDPRVVEGTRWVTGADVAGQPRARPGRRPRLHRRRHHRGRRGPRRRPLSRTASDGGVLETARGIEMGHIFQLGRKYADALGLQVLDENGKLVTVTMGSYGIGPSRAVAAIAEGTHDELGLCWPRDVAPADVHLVATGKDEAIFAAADRIAVELSQQGVDGALRRPAQGQPRREVQGRRADRRPDHRRGRPQPRRRHGRGRDRRTGEREEVPPATWSTTSSTWSAPNAESAQRGAETRRVGANRR